MSLLHDIPPDKPVGQLPPQPWLRSAAANMLFAALTAEGDSARFVGGCVRDGLAGRPVRDLDISTTALPEHVMRLLRSHNIRALPTGLDHGTVTAVIGEQRFEVTTLRTDVACDGRRARVVFTEDWLDDATRRDFTINAMSCDQDGRIYDPFDGISDLSAGHIRFIGEAKKRVEEDVLRILRFFRFYAHYGRPPVSADALSAIRVAAEHLDELSGERMYEETAKLLMGSDPAGVLLLMQSVRVLDYLLPEAKHFGRLRQLCFLESRGVVRDDVTPDAERRLAALLDPDGVGDVCDRFRLSREQRRRLRQICEPAVPVTPDMSDADLMRLCQDGGQDSARDILLLGWSEIRTTDPRGAAADTKLWCRRLDKIRHWEPKEFPLQGRDLQALGIGPGPQMGALLAAAEHWWEEEGFTPDRTALLNFVRKRLKGR